MAVALGPQQHGLAPQSAVQHLQQQQEEEDQSAPELHTNDRHTVDDWSPLSLPLPPGSPSLLLGAHLVVLLLAYLPASAVLLA